MALKFLTVIKIIKINYITKRKLNFFLSSRCSVIVFMENAIKRIQEVYLFLFDKVYLTFLFT